ncbi:arginyl-tRNA synthetase [Mycoplasmoides fastidiosum]|uniref:Arginine--tRNA ligase n=1 Tax=Mycoplasmoides fastidiosum TaxID=92758 RepID=A0ABU0LZT7_9BACT|nr:arginine--tRNA ligase [Mycoplasmoides fastidiosum]MDQ0514222.1 arginyl-tRNA synthetase [Mycoplasmoides fastidiosum]UUD37370.1 arginine--tRNA ligase [Mycoplasmoides fastidiosum]
MLKRIQEIIHKVLVANNLPSDFVIKVEKTKKISFGDFSTNVAIIVARLIKQNPQTIANLLINHLRKYDEFTKVEFALPGFINFNLQLNNFTTLAQNIRKKGNDFGQQPTKPFIYLVELVSANPTGLLHVGHARNGIFGDTLVNLLKFAGYQVDTEYLINDAGNQINNLAKSVYCRYLQICGVDVLMPEDGYNGQEIISCALAFYHIHEQQFLDHQPVILEQFATDYFLEEIKTDLKQYQIQIDHFFSEKSMHQNQEITEIFTKFKNHTYHKDGALWFASSQYLNNDKDEVLVKSDGQITYYAQDLAYHWNKIQRIQQKNSHYQLIDIWGSDHHGHVSRLQAFLKAINQAEKVSFLLTQLVRLIKNGQELKMSKRTGNSLLMRDMYEIIGYDALRWYLVAQSINTHIDIDLDLIKEESASNPIYYVLYAYARIWQILNKVTDFEFQPTDFSLLTTGIERELINHLYFFETNIIQAAENYEPHRICNYLFELAKLLHTFYNSNKILNLTDAALKQQRLHLIYVVQQILFNGLAILKITPQKQMQALN